MIQEFSLKNFLSFDGKQTIDLLASKDKTHLDELTFEPKEGVKILKLLMILVLIYFYYVNAAVNWYINLAVNWYIGTFLGFSPTVNQQIPIY